jgi:hypothetical protein
MGILHEDQYTFLITSCSLLLRIQNVSDKSHRENKTHTLCSIPILRKSCCYEIRWKNFVEMDRPKMKIWYMRSL